MIRTDADVKTVVLHCSDAAEDVQRAVAAASTITTDDPSIRAEVIVNGAALEGLRLASPPVEPGARVSVRACSMGLSKRGIPSSDLQTEVGLTDSAVVALSQAQFEGAAYLRI